MRTSMAPSRRKTMPTGTIAIVAVNSQRFLPGLIPKLEQEEIG
jgi:hypothetical protein